MSSTSPTSAHHPTNSPYNKSRFASFAIACAVVLTGFATSQTCSADENSVLEHLASTDSTAYLQRGDFRIEPLVVAKQEGARKVSAQKNHSGPFVFQKFIKDIPLHGGRVFVFEKADGSVQQVFDDSSEDLKMESAEPTLKAEACEELIEEAVANVIDSESKLVWFRIGAKAIIAWEVTTSLADSGKPACPTGLETVVDATSGKILSQRQLDKKTYQAGSPEVASDVFPRIVINNAIGAAGSRAFAAPFDAVVEVDFGCTGTLIADNVVLSARHCAVRAGATVIFGDNANGGGIFRSTVQSSFLPDGNGNLLDGGDVAILTLTEPVPANVATPMRLIDETDALEGMVCVAVGYGFNGLGSNGHGNSADGRRWGGENIIDVYGRPASSNGSNIISTDFDDGSGGANRIPGSSPTPLEFEATTSPGDSGGPVLVQIGDEWLIAGVLSGGSTDDSAYGDISWWTGTADFRSAIEARGGRFAGGIEVAILGGVPDFISPTGGDTIDIEAFSETELIVPGSGIFHVDTGTGFEEFALTENSATSFTAAFPPSECLTSVDFYISFDLQSGGTVTLPNDAPSSSFSVLSATDVANVFNDSFDSDMGWSVTGSAVEGRWQRAVPNNGDRGDPAADAENDGNGFCFVTDNDNSQNDNSDVDDGETVLTSPVMDASSETNETAFLSYFRWYSNDFGDNPNTSPFDVEISNDGGATWSNLETVGPAGDGTSGGWILVEHQIDSTIVPTDNMRVRFTAVDLEGSIIEAGVDAVTIRLVACEPDVPVGDINLDGFVDFSDIPLFITLLSSGGFQAEADINKDGTVDFSDIAPFIGLLSS